jgi:hypothetical protein
VYCAIGLVLVVLVAALTITAAETPPPAIAEFAPEATKQITDAPVEQTSDAGTADGGLGVGGLTTTTTVPAGAPITKAPAPKPRANRCIGTPPRQTEDYQSPPCVPLWEGTENGGATSKGVTGDEIRIAVPCDSQAKSGDIRPGEFKSPECSKPDRHQLALEAHFNSRYELYGRKIRLVPFVDKGNITSCENMLADATKVDAEIGAFASTAYAYQRGREGCYYNELARRKIISAQAVYVGAPNITQAQYAAKAPYQWNYNAPVDEIELNLAELVCKQLKGRPPSYAKGTTQLVATRKFGLFTDTFSNGIASVDDGPLLRALKACGVEPVRYTGSAGDAMDGPARSAIGQNALTLWQNEGVTSVICLCDHSFIINGLMQPADISSPPYYPEYVFQNYQGQEGDYVGVDYSATQQASQVIGMRTWNKPLPREQMPYWQALRESDPTFPASDFNYDTLYWNLLILTSGIQLAGPRLTAETFQDGLQKARFPNPTCGRAPQYQACVGFQGSHTMVKDFAPVWFNINVNSIEYQGANYRNTAPGPRPLGAYCYVDQGLRYKAGTWPAEAPGFGQGACL